AAREAEPAGGDAAAEQREHPLRRVLAEIAEGRDAREPGALEPGIRVSLNELDSRPEAEAAVDPRRAGKRLAHDQGRRLRIHALPVATDGATHIEAAAPVERLGLVAEVAQDRVVTAAPALDPPYQLQEQAPLVLQHRRRRRHTVGAALEERAPERQVAGAHEEEPEGIGAVAPGASHLLVIRLDGARRA